MNPTSTPPRSSSTPQKTLPARYYTDPEIFRGELESFFCRTWICAGRSEQVASAGDFFLREVAGESIVITRDAGGGLRAFYNVCRHRGTRICREREGCFPGRIQCPYHGWTYGLDGRLLGAPHMEESFQREEYPLHGVRVEEWAGHVFLNLDPQAQPLDTQLADLPQKFAPWRMQDLRLHKRIAYEVAANWKLIVTNYNECLHCPVLHPMLSRISNYLSGENDPPQPTYIGGSMEFREAAETMSVDGKRRRAFLPGLSEERCKQVLYYTIFPNLLVSLHPDYMMTHTLWPQAVDRTHVICEWHFHPDEMAKPDFHAEDAVEFWDITNREDWGITELSQKGISSRAYTPGPYSGQEGLPSAFDRMILERERNGR
jgi:phenylpropionate dioxygenase-like ring-hydroxylating dioxygenase large terminal subunit